MDTFLGILILISCYGVIYLVEKIINPKPKNDITPQEDKAIKNIIDVFIYEQKRPLTKKNYRLYKHIINPNNLKRGKEKNDYQLDHKYSILEGYKNNIPIEIISSYVNLEILPLKENLSKQDRCSITKEMLYEAFNNIGK